MKPTYVYLEEKDKELLKAAADKQCMSMSAYVKEQILGFLINPGNVPENAEPLYDSDNQPEKTKRDKQIKLYLSDAEYEAITKAAGGMSVNSYIRRALLSAGAGKYVFNISTDDLKELNESIADIAMHVSGFIGALRFREDIYAADVERIEGLLDELNDGVQKLNKQILENRYSIRQQGRRTLEKQLKAVNRGD